MTQLDLKCAQAGETLAQIKGVDEKLLNSALAVLQEQGLYACFLYLCAQGKKPARELSRKLFEFLRTNLSLDVMVNDTQMLNAIARLSENLDDLLFARELLLQTLIYARYHLKAKGEGS
jgi:hypothetical protein